MQEFQGRLRALIDDYQRRGQGVAGVAITQDGGLPVIALCADRTFATASLYKLFVLWGVQRAIAAGDLADDTLLTFLAEDDDSEEDGYLLWTYGEQISVAELRDLMITTSNNSAAWVLARTVGWGTIDALLRERGFEISRAANGVSTPIEIARFFDELVAGTLDPSLRPADYALMLELLGDQQINGYLSAGFPPGTDFAHKTGNLPGIVNDAGILTLPSGRVVTLVVLAEGDEWASFALMEELAALVWEYYGE
jgi:beta-lactamase class A